MTEREFAACLQIRAASGASQPLTCLEVPRVSQVPGSNWTLVRVHAACPCNGEPAAFWYHLFKETDRSCVVMRARLTFRWAKKIYACFSPFDRFVLVWGE